MMAWKISSVTVVEAMIVVAICSILLAIALPHIQEVERRKTCADIYGAAQDYREGTSRIQQRWSFRDGNCILTQTTVSELPGG